ncbi:hypothetical protein Desaci_2449 [Desulfosporosinus acidiphilus SJ4]|uniref:Uncharacterized protein n=1 Tax=Desulfosporosinus acidiphilus (strain DSM 22704 / JCM 16185 / SJ4) TaxID=646529 RepID=I4D6H5_DESAJ|nr:hypothetical protein [Desulfosporosinus acidiphilus]AFM41399.1 hypothetical protein Desaci_2449 [Desulfosporosinus acidiphilus SJ4]
MSQIKVTNLTFAYDGSYDNLFEIVSFQKKILNRLQANNKLGAIITTLLSTVIVPLIRKLSLYLQKQMGKACNLQIYKI